MEFNIKITLPILPLRDIVFFPGTIAPLFVGRDSSIKVIHSLDETQRMLIVLTQKNPNVDNPSFEDLYSCGVLTKVIKFVELPDGTYKMLLEGKKRVRVNNVLLGHDFLITNDYTHYEQSENISKELELSLMKAIIEKFREYSKLNKKSSHQDLMEELNHKEELSECVDLIGSNIDISVEQKQKLLSNTDGEQLAVETLVVLEGKIDLLKIEQKIHQQVKEQIDQNQKEYYLNEQIKAIQTELGEDDPDQDLENFRKKAERLKLSKEAKAKVDDEIKRLEMISPQSAEYSITRAYIETLLSLPWKKKTKIHYDLEKAQSVLDDTHYGLEKVKERILEHLAVCKRNKKSPAAVLCLIGPPGVGKTSFARSIAKATGHNFVRMSLGGVREEAEIRGHRRTYIASMPGGIIKNIIKAQSSNPLFLIDEIDKMGMDYRGDPASALLEVFDPEQNQEFKDHYLDVGYDLSNVMFITTANSYQIPRPLLDRMEVIDVNGYTEQEKVAIFKNHLLPEMYKKYLLTEKEFSISNPAVQAIVRLYTRESGVRSLGQQLDKLARKVVLQLSQNVKGKIIIDSKKLEKYLGSPKFSEDFNYKERVGQVLGLAWSEQGGDVLLIEAASFSGKGRLKYTGHLGDVMQESIQTAMTVIKSSMIQAVDKKDFFKDKDLHIHVPDGATPKDGPSAGMAMCLVIASLVLDQKCRCDTAVTGEITLRGEVTKIGGLKEKLLAAHRHGMKYVLIPQSNKSDLLEIPDFVLKKLKIIPVSNIQEAFGHFFDMKSFLYSNLETHSVLSDVEVRR